MSEPGIVIYTQQAGRTLTGTFQMWVQHKLLEEASGSGSFVEGNGQLMLQAETLLHGDPLSNSLFLTLGLANGQDEEKHCRLHLLTEFSGVILVQTETHRLNVSGVGCPPR